MADVNQLVTKEDFAMMTYGNRTYTITTFDYKVYNAYTNNPTNSNKLIRAYYLKNNGYNTGDLPIPFTGSWSSYNDNFLIKISDLRRTISITNGGSNDPNGYCSGYPPGWAISFNFIWYDQETSTAISTISSGYTGATTFYYYPPDANNSKGVPIPCWPGNSKNPYCIAMHINSITARSHNNKPASFSFSPVGGGHVNANQSVTFCSNMNYPILMHMNKEANLQLRLTVTGT